MALPHVLLVTGSYPPMFCGVGDHAAGLARAVAATGQWRVSVLTSSAAKPAISGDGVDVLAQVREWSLGALPTIVRDVRSIKPDLVHIQVPTQGYGRGLAPWLLPLALKCSGFRVIQTWHEYVPHAYSMRPFLLALAASDVLVVRPDYEKRLPWLHRWAMRSARIIELAPASQIPASGMNDAQRASMRRQLADGAERLVGYFGFAYPHKRIELLFEACDPARTRLLLMTQLSASDPYHAQLMRLAAQPEWSGRVTVTGFLGPEAVADYLTASDDVVLPFASGGGSWNSSLHAVQIQGTHLIVTSVDRRGYAAGENTTFCAPNDMSALRAALTAGGHPRRPPTVKATTWDALARVHIAEYGRTLGTA